MTAVSAQSLTTSRLCATENCIEEAGRGELCPRCEERAARRRTPLTLRDPLGLEFDPLLELEAWTATVRRVAQIRTAASFWIGDLVAHSALDRDVKLKIAAAELDLPEASISGYEWTARNVPRARRRQGLSYSHHREVAALPPDEQDEWLEKAASGRWTVRRLEAELRAAGVRRRETQLDEPPVDAHAPRDRRGQPGGEQGTRVTISVTAPADRVYAWHAAAEQRGWSLAQLTATALDEFVGA